MSRFLKLEDAVNSLPVENKSLRVLLLADDKHPAEVILQHINSIKNKSKHKVTIVNSRLVTEPTQDNFEVIVIHYSIYLIYTTYLSIAWGIFIKNFKGPVIVIHEDEYQVINRFIAKFSELRIGALFSCLNSVENLKLVYDNWLLKDTIFIACLPGYLPPVISHQSPPSIANRPLDIVYRGRMLRPDLGKLGYEKYLIGEQMKMIATRSGLKFDINSDEDKRIYGQSWSEFLMTGKVMLGVEGGASIFDFDGSIRRRVERYIKKNSNSNFPQIWDAVLKKHEGNIEFKTITPKFFEAIASKTGLVLYPGEYSGILKPHKNYIPLERDLSNANEVIALIRNDHYLQEMVDRNYDEIFSREDLSQAYYVKGLDNTIDFLSNSIKPNKKYY